MTTTDTLTLPQFLEQCIAADEAAAQAAGPDGGEWFSRRPESPEYHNFGEFGWTVSGPDIETHDSEWGRAVADHIATHDPARVLRQCAAFRAIVEMHEASDRFPCFSSTRGVAPTCSACVAVHADMDCENEPYPCPTLRALATIFADRPGWQEAWS